MTTWDDDCASKLATRMNTLAVASSSSWAVGTNIFTGRPRPPDASGSNAVGEEAIFCFISGGPRGREYAGGTDSDATVPEGERFPTLTVYYRGKRRDSDRSKTVVEGIANALHLFPPTGFYECIALGSYPDFVQEDDAGREEWLQRFQLKREF